MMKRYRIHFSGRVQGVGFRYTTLKASRHFDVRGTVQNLSDGRVELVVESTRGEMEDFVRQISETTHGNVNDVEIEISDEDQANELVGFEIIQ